MTDLALLWNGPRWSADLMLEAADLATDDGLMTAVIISLFSDARAAADDPLPAPGDRRGWWGDALALVDADLIGSRLWLLAREKRTPATLERARGYAAQALAWLVADGVADRVDVSVEAQGGLAGGALVLAIGVEIVRPAGPGRLRFDFVWDATQLLLSSTKAS